MSDRIYIQPKPTTEQLEKLRHLFGENITIEEVTESYVAKHTATARPSRRPRRSCAFPTAIASSSTTVAKTGKVRFVHAPGRVLKLGYSEQLLEDMVWPPAERAK